MRRLVMAALVIGLVALGAYFAFDAWRTDEAKPKPPTAEPWHIELRPVNKNAPFPCGRAPYRPCNEHGAIILRDAASSP